MVERSADWMAQAKRNIEVARNLIKAGVFEWACFLAQQAADLALKALLQRLGADAWGRSVFGLMEGLPNGFRPPGELIEHGKELDKAYIPTRYPNAHPRGAPFQLYTADEARRLLNYGEKVVKFCEDKISQASP